MAMRRGNGHHQLRHPYAGGLVIRGLVAAWHARRAWLRKVGDDLTASW